MGWAGPKGRSCMMAWAAMGGPWLDLSFAFAAVVIRAEWRRRSAVLMGHPTSDAASSAWAKVFARWGWADEGGMDVHTLLGTFSPAWHTVDAFLRAAVQAWHQDLWNGDGRTGGAGPLGRRALILDEHVRIVNLSSRAAFRAVTASVVDGRLLQRVDVQTQCKCGMEAPPTEHMVFDCPLAPQGLGDGYTRAERKLLVAVVPFAARDGGMEVELDDELAQFIQLARENGDSLFCATDGGCLIAAGMEHWQRAAWAIAAKAGNQEIVVHGLVPGPEQTPAAAERHALAVLAAHTAGNAVEGVVLTDNDAAVRRIARAARGDFAGPLAAFWQRVTAGLGDLIVHWIPSLATASDPVGFLLREFAQRWPGASIAWRMRHAPNSWVLSLMDGKWTLLRFGVREGGNELFLNVRWWRASRSPCACERSMAPSGTAFERELVVSVGFPCCVFVGL